MSYRPSLHLHFGTKFTGEAPQLKLWDNSASVFRSITIPAGTYFFKYSNTLLDIVSVLNTLLSGYVLVTRANDRQLQWTFTDSNDYLMLDSSSDALETRKLASLLGWHDNTGDLDYRLVAPVRTTYVTQVTSASWFTESGTVYETADLRGFPHHDETFTARQDGKSARLAGTKRKLLEGLRLTALDQNEVRVDEDLGTQATLNTTLNSTWSVAFWTAYDPLYHEPTFWLYSSSQTGRYWLLKPVEQKDVKPSVALWSGLFDLTMDVLFAGDELPVGFGGHLTLNDGLLCCFNLQDNAGSTYVTDATGRTSGTASANTSALFSAAGVLPGGSSAFRGGANNDRVQLNNLEAVTGQYIAVGKPFSLSMWINQTTTVAYAVLYGRQTGTGTTPQIYLCYYNTNRQIEIDFVRAVGNQRTMYGNTVLTNGQWYHVVVAYNGATSLAYNSGDLKMYVNGTLQTLSARLDGGTIDTTVNNSTHHLACDPLSVTLDYVGNMQQFCAWSRQIDATEVSDLYNGGSGLAY